MIYWLPGGGNNWTQAALATMGLIAYLFGSFEGNPDDCIFTASCPAHLY